LKKSYLLPFLLICILLSSLSVYFLSKVFFSANHTLKQEKDWVAVKLMGRQGLMGAVEFSSLRQTLAKDQLNLGEWHGHNEVIWNQVKSWNKLQFDFKPEKKSYIWIVFSKSQSSRAGFRLSLNEKKPSGFFKINERGKFIDSKFFNTAIKNNWNLVKITKDQGDLQLFLNDELVYSSKDNFDGFDIISFRSGIFKVAVDNFKIQQDQYTYKENFSPRFSMKLFKVSILYYFSIIFFLVIACFLALKKKAFFVILGLQFLFLIITSGYYFIDKNFIASAYLFDGFLPFGQKRYSEATLGFEKTRASFFEKINSFANIHEKKEVLAGPIKTFNSEQPFVRWPFMQQILPSGNLVYPNSAEEVKAVPKGVVKITFMGTSQTWGAGAQGVRNNFVSQFTFKTMEKLKKPVSTFNLSICGVDSSVLINEYDNLLKIWKPNFLIVNLSNNDGGKDEQFTKNLRDIALRNKELQIKTIFVFEATDTEVRSSNLSKNHKIMLKVAEEFNFPVFNLHGYLASPEIQDSGFIWFDIVHFDQQGHDLTAAWLFENIFPIISSQPRSK
jgi:lysophospholipase L1-like esterase